MNTIDRRIERLKQKLGKNKPTIKGKPIEETKQFGLTREQIKLNFLLDQDNRCAICRQDFKSSKATHLDHCHESKLYRGVLCHNCNLGLGYFKDNPAILLEAVEYLTKER